MATVLRMAMLYFMVLVGLRILGKRDFGQLTPIELVALLLIPELGSQAILGEDFSMVNALIAITTLLTIVYLMSVVTHFSKKAAVVVNAKPAVLVHNGQILEEIMNKERVEPDEIYAEMHKVGLERLEQVQWAILESDGKISIVPEPSHYLVGGKQQNEAIL